MIRACLGPTAADGGRLRSWCRKNTTALPIGTTLNGVPEGAWGGPHHHGDPWKCQRRAQATNNNTTCLMTPMWVAKLYHLPAPNLPLRLPISLSLSSYPSYPSVSLLCISLYLTLSLSFISPCPSLPLSLLLPLFLTVYRIVHGVWFRMHTLRRHVSPYSEPYTESMSMCRLIYVTGSHIAACIRYIYFHVHKCLWNISPYTGLNTEYVIVYRIVYVIYFQMQKVYRIHLLTQNGILNIFPHTASYLEYISICEIMYGICSHILNCTLDACPCK